MTPNDHQSATHRILSVYEEELNRIVLDVHDGPVQNMFAVLSLLSKMQHEIETTAPASPTLLPSLKRVTELIESSLHEIKFFLGTFRSPEFQRRPLELLVKSLVLQHEEWTGQTVVLTMHDVPDPVGLPIKIALYRILQEALSNTHRHAGVDHIWVKLWGEQQHIILKVFDYGHGFTPPPLDGPDATEQHEHIGLRGMRDRVALVNGTFELESRPGEGTKILVKVPLDDD